MIHCVRSLRSTAALSNKLVFEMGGSKRKKTPSDLESYDVVYVGANLGGICR